MSSYLTIRTPGLPATIATALTLTTRSVYGPDGEFEGAVVEAAKLTGQHDEDTIRRAITICEDHCRPGGHEIAAQELALLERKTVGARQAEADQRLRGAAYAADLAQYPADIIRAACKRWADGNRWWPAWADLKRECDRLSSKRRAEHRALVAALQQLTARPQLEAPKVGVTAAERSRDLIAYRRGQGNLRGAALEERWLAQHQGRDIEAWARPLLAEMDATAEQRREEFLALAGEPKPAGSAAALAELAKQARERLMRDEAAA
jgi:hypothetical protein